MVLEFRALTMCACVQRCVGVRMRIHTYTGIALVWWMRATGVPNDRDIWPAFAGLLLANKLQNVYHPCRLIVHYLPTTSPLPPWHRPCTLHTVPLPRPPVPGLLMTKSEVTALFILVTRHHFAPLMFSITTGAFRKHSGMRYGLLTLTTTPELQNKHIIHSRSVL